MGLVDPARGTCHAFGVTGAAMRHGDMKLLITHNGSHPWEDSSPAGTAQYTPGGRYPNGTAVFTPAVPDAPPPEPYLGVCVRPSQTQSPAP